MPGKKSKQVASKIDTDKVYQTTKIVDTLADQVVPSRMIAWWELKGFVPLYKEFRKGAISEGVLRKMGDIRQIDIHFGLKGYQFGGWVSSTEDKFNYLSALAICLYDLNKVMLFYNNNIGFGILGIAFGARGRSRAQAHYEPTTNVINLTRYKSAASYKDNPFFEKVPTKEQRFVYTGGPGALAHEYGHFLDFTFGRGVEPYNGKLSLSGGKDSYEKGKTVYSDKYPLRQCMEELLTLICTSKGDKSAFVKRIERLKNSKRYKKYLLERCEIFARVFEQYIAYKLREKNIQNAFLTDTKYDPILYLTPKELSSIVPKMDELLRHFRRYINDPQNLEQGKKK
ncbi:MAG: LPD1 domain-containing protein [Aureispira sp.]